MTLGLHDYLAASTNSRLREELTTSKLVNELQLTAFVAQRRLKIYTPALDNEGCDIIIEDDMDHARKFQLKTVIKGGKVPSWSIHSRILLPDMQRAPDYGLSAIICPPTPGAVILQKVSATSETTIAIDYFYTDINVISFFAIADAPTAALRKRQTIALRILKELANKEHRIAVPRSVFVKLRSAAAILEIAGFHNHTQFDFDCHRLNQLHYGLGRTSNAPREKAYHAVKIQQHLEGFAS